MALESGALDKCSAPYSERVDILVHVLRSTTLEPLAPRLQKQGFLDGLNVKVLFGEYNQFEQEIAGLGSLPATQPDFVLVAARLDDLAPALVKRYLGTPIQQREALGSEVVARIEGWLDTLRARWSDATVLLLGLEQPATPPELHERRTVDSRRGLVARLNDKLAELCRVRTNVYFVDVDAALAEIGRRDAYDPRLWAHARLAYSNKGLDALAALLSRFISALKIPRRKCIILDCDNTLWGGVLGEDGIDAIALGPEYPGSAYVGFQEALLRLHDRGIVLALCTKNNAPDVFEVLDAHPSQVLRRDSFAAMKIGWGDKVTAITELAQELNIGLGAMIFIDDSPFECELVRGSLPEVLVVQAPAEPLGLTGILEELHILDSLELSYEDYERGKMYQVRASSLRAKEAFDSVDDYLRSLEIRLELSWTRGPQIARVAQLTQKTNQFNLTTRRYTDSQIEAYIGRRDVMVVHAHLTDKFGEQGLTGLVILFVEGHALRIDTLLLSCRVIGRKVEDAVVAWVIQHAERGGSREVIGDYIPTGRNSQTSDFFSRFGFDRMDDEGSRWRWPVGRPTPRSPDWIKVTRPIGEGPQ